MQKKSHKKAVVFGVFDGLHTGHLYFLNKAKSHCDELIVVLTLSEVVEKLKNKSPQFSFEERSKVIKDFNPQLIVIAGDAKLGEWTVFASHNPDIVILGHDQHAIAHELKKLNKSFKFLKAHHPEKYKSSLLGK
jgi:cytidyltransferase-like protein